MRDRMERFALIPFSLGCESDSCVAVATTHQLPQNKYTDSTFLETRQKEGARREKSTKKRRRGFMALPKPFFSKGMHRLIKSLKSFSHLFVYKEEMEEKEIEIGFPTDVKHVSHIGLDGSTTINPVPEWKNLKPPEIISFPTISLEQFELAMAAQSHAPLTTIT
ncbi:CRIB domain-containing protein RIC4 [Abeliophyllum distichum]|uniref:CRIB domain-containing protein RIC4 n=1 Tax=Abeliophyllum distichum TaxID=126358 RepID=A0ABD1Q1W7_9LAMI